MWMTGTGNGNRRVSVSVLPLRPFSPFIICSQLHPLLFLLSPRPVDSAGCPFSLSFFVSLYPLFFVVRPVLDAEFALSAYPYSYQSVRD